MHNPVNAVSDYVQHIVFFRYTIVKYYISRFATNTKEDMK